MEKIERIIRCLRRLRGNTAADTKLLDAVEDAAKSSCRKFYALSGFRYHMLRLVMEIQGCLFQFMLLWFLGGLVDVPKALVDDETIKQIAGFRSKSFKEQVDEVLAGSVLIPAAMEIIHSDFFVKPQGGESSLNAFKEVVDGNKGRLTQRFPTILRELAFLLEDKTEFPKADFKCNEMKLPDPEPADMMELAKVLQDEHNGLTMLCRSKPLLTHLENFRSVLLHARLWLLRSELPVCFGSTVSYNDLRSGALESMIEDRAKESIPSRLEYDHMEATVFAHSRLRATEEVYHMKLEDYLPSSRWDRPGYPVTITHGEKEKSFSFWSWRQGLEEDEDVRGTVRAFERAEIPRVLAPLREFNSKSFAQFAYGF